MLARVARRAIAPVVDLIAPETCWAGGTGEVTYTLSDEKRLQIGLLSAQPWCLHCGLSIGPFEEHNVKNPCGRCGQREAGVAHVARVGVFEDPLVTLIHRLKFGKSWEVAGVLAPFLYQAIQRASEGAGTKVDLLVPVPLHWWRLSRRGFNQAEELARETAKLSGWKWANVLRRTRSTVAQARTSSITQRRENLRGAFACRPNAAAQIAGKHVWLVDDVTTTGATLHAAASALRQLPRGQKPASINAAVICVTDHQSPNIPSS